MSSIIHVHGHRRLYLDFNCIKSIIPLSTYFSHYSFIVAYRNVSVCNYCDLATLIAICFSDFLLLYLHNSMFYNLCVNV